MVIINFHELIKKNSVRRRVVKKMFRLMTMFLTLSTLTFIVKAESIYLNNGSAHTISDDIHKHDNIFLDIDVVNNPGTHLDVIDGGNVDGIIANNNSSANIVNSTVGYAIWANDNSTLSITNGTVGYQLIASDDSVVTITNGTIGDQLSVEDNSVVNLIGGVYFEPTAIGESTLNIFDGTMEHIHAFHSSTVTLSGGTVNGILYATQNATFFLDGTGFSVTSGGSTTALEYGDRLSDFGSFFENGDYDFWKGTITGTLSNGSPLNNEFHIYNMGANAGIGDIVVIPEPSTFSLFSLVGLMLRKIYKSKMNTTN